MFIRFLAFLLLLPLVALSAWANDLVRVDLPDIQHISANLLVVDATGHETIYTPADLEEFATYQMTTVTPWRVNPARFEGVLLADILERHGLDQSNGILVTAENDYQTAFDQNLIANVDILVATRVDGRPHSRRERGPIQFVIHHTVFDSSPLTSESNLVWMAARIEPRSQ